MRWPPGLPPEGARALRRPESLGAGRLGVAHACLGPVVAIGFKAAGLARARAAAKG